MLYRVNTQLYIQTAKSDVSILRLNLNDFYRYSTIRSFMMNVIDKINPVCLLFDDTVQASKKGVTLCHFPKKHLLIKENIFYRFTYFVKKGMTRSLQFMSGERITTSSFCEEGTVFSMDGLYYNKLSEELVGTLEDVAAYKISLAGLNRLFQTNIELANWGRIIHQNGYRRLQRSHKERLVLLAKERYEEFKQQFPQMCQRVNLGYIASYLGTKLSALSRLKAQE